MLSQVTAALLSLSLFASASAELVPHRSAHKPASVQKRQASYVVQCAANSFDQVPTVLAACNFVSLYNITVPAGQTLDLSAAQPNSVIFFGRAISFVPQPGFAGPLVRISGTGLYVNGGAGYFAGFGDSYWAATGTRPVVVSIENTQNSTFEKLTVATAPQTAVQIINSSGLTFKGLKVLNQAAFISNSTTYLTAVNSTGSSSISILNLNVTTTGKCGDFSQVGSSLSLYNATCLGGGLLLPNAPSSTLSLTNINVTSREATSLSIPAGLVTATNITVTGGNLALSGAAPVSGTFTNVNVTTANPTAFSVPSANSLTVNNGRFIGGNVVVGASGSATSGVTFNTLIVGVANATANVNALDIQSGSGITVNGASLNGAGVSVGSKYNPTTISNVAISNAAVNDAINGIQIVAVTQKGAMFGGFLGGGSSSSSGSMDGVSFSYVQLNGITGQGLLIANDFTNGAETGVSSVLLAQTLKNIDLTNISGTTVGSASNYKLVVGMLTCMGADFESVSISGGSGASSCSCRPYGFKCT